MVLVLAVVGVETVVTLMAFAEGLLLGIIGGDNAEEEEEDDGGGGGSAGVF
jgi:hypothetical protein